MQTEEQRKETRRKYIEKNREKIRAYEKKYMYEKYGVTGKKKPPKGKHYQYVHKETGRLFGIPVKLTRKEYKEIKRDTMKFMSRRGYELKEVEIMNDYQISKDYYFIDDKKAGEHWAMKEHNPDIPYLEMPYHSTSNGGKVASRPAS